VNEFEQRWFDLGEFIREQRRIGHLSLRKLSEMAGISNPYLSQIERGLRKPSADILRQIAAALHISAETLYVRAGILDEPGGPTDLIAEIRRAGDLDEDQKRALVQIYETFRRERATRSEPDLDEALEPAASTAGGEHAGGEESPGAA
jgi:transcriptional regulator with XRE-family HTH domain